MKVSDLIVEVRDANLNRVGQILATDLVGFTGVLRFRKVGTWEIPLRYDNPLADSLRAPGAGLIVTGPNGVLFSGPTTSATRTQSQDDTIGTWTIRGVTDEVVLGERLAYPTPTTADVTLQTSEQDVRSGVASTVMYAFVNANIGPSAPSARKIAALTLAADGALGSTVTGRTRFENLGNLLTRLAQIDGLGFNIKQSGSNLVFTVFQPTDRSSTIRMDIDNNLLTKSEYTYTSPTATRAIVAGAGAGSTRLFSEVTTSDSTTAETAWKRRIEVFRDQRQSNSTAELTQAGTEELADKGRTLEAISVSPSDDNSMAFGVDWALGDKVSVVAGSTTISQVVTEVGISVQADGVRIGATVGEPSVADENSDLADVTQDQEARITNLEVNAATPAPQSPNYLINSAFDVWSLGTSGTPTSSTTTYVADMWESFRGGFVAGLTVSRQAAGLSGFQYCARIQRTAATTDTTIIYTGQPLKTADSLLSVGKTVTLSFYARAGANYSSSANGLIVQLRQGTGTDQTIRAGFTGQTNIIATTATLTTSWQLFTYSATVGASATELGAVFSYTPVGTAGANDYFEVTGVQLEQGSVATPYRRNAPTAQAEVAATGAITGTTATLTGDVTANNFVSRNYVINGAMDVWQRGTSPSTNVGAGIYGADRWRSTIGGPNATISQDTSVPNQQFLYSMKMVPYANGTGAEWAFRQVLERRNVQALTGQTVTASAWIRSSKTSVKIRVIGNANTVGGTDITQTFTVTANTWTYISAQFSSWAAVTAWSGTPEAIGGYLDVGYVDNQAVTTSDYLYVTGVQLEAGSVATPFRRHGQGIQAELAACQRYYYRMGGNLYEQFGVGFTASVNTQARFYVKHPVTMRTNPLSMEYSTMAIYDGTTVIAVSSAAMNSGQTGRDAAWVEVATPASTAFRPQALIANASTSAYLAFSAEL